MAELIIGAVGFGLGTPGLIIAFAQCGEYIEKKINTFKNAPQVVLEIGKFGHDLNQGKLKLSMELAQWAYSLEGLDQAIKDSIEDLVNKLASLLQEADYVLSKLVDKHGNVKRTYLTLIGERKAQQVVKSLRNWQHDFFNIISMVEMRKRVMKRDLELPWNKYRPKFQEALSGHSDILVGEAEILRNGEAAPLQVLIERKEIMNENIRADIQEVASILESSPYWNTTGGGVLKCLGYREESKNVELIFELPETTKKPQMLSDIIAAGQGKRNGGGHPLDHKIRLALQLCDTVFAVFTFGLVHKSIRSDTILLLHEKPRDNALATHTANGFGNPYLTSWSLLRKATGLTSGPPVSAGYVHDLYRHPKRQGIQPEQRYNIGHDIYSLGVCLLEISLWEPFFDRDGQPSQLYRNMATELGNISFENVQSTEKMMAPWIMHKVLIALAKIEAPPRVGLGVSNLIVACLTCLEGGMGDPECFRRNPNEAAVRFNSIVSQSFALQA